MSKGKSDRITYKPYEQNQPYLIPPSADELIPKDHLVRLVSEVIDEMGIKRCPHGVSYDLIKRETTFFHLNAPSPLSNASASSRPRTKVRFISLRRRIPDERQPRGVHHPVPADDRHHPLHV